MTLSDVALIDSLLLEAEGTSLDFKRDQYPFYGATDHQKSELLKDILSFANAWRRSDAYILIGVEALVGQMPTVVGISTHVDDAALQQFVNSKTHRPVEFSYRTVSYKGVFLGLFHIPLQSRPHSLKRAFGRLAENTVYLRRGSSTSIATPDEIALMGRASSSDAERPNLVLDFVDSHGQTRVSNPISVISRVIDFEAVRLRVVELLGPRAPGALTLIARRPGDLDRQVATRILHNGVVSCFKPRIMNTSTVPADHVTLTMAFTHDPEVFAYSDRDLPSIDSPFPGLVLPKSGSDIASQVVGVVHRLSVDFGTIRPGESATTNGAIAVGSIVTKTTAMETTILSRALEPIQDNWTFEIETQPLVPDDADIRMMLGPWI